MLVNVYATVRELPFPSFEHTLRGHVDRSDASLRAHLDGFAGFVMQGGRRQMSATRYHVLRHLERVKHHLSLEVEADELERMAKWATAANAILFMEDSSVCDPQCRVLVDAETGEPQEGAEMPFPSDAQARKQRSIEVLHKLDIPVAMGLPPCVGVAETELRDAQSVARRALALFGVAVRAESSAEGDPIPTAEIKARFPQAAFSPQEEAFLSNDAPSQHEIVQFAWRYESLWLLQWALGWQDELPWPTKICDVPAAAGFVMQSQPEQLVNNARLRDTAEILDELDCHLRLHWATREAQRKEQAAPAELDGGVIQERHYALNWLVGFAGAEWDEVDTPT